jgi:hypothetical protein
MKPEIASLRIRLTFRRIGSPQPIRCVLTNVSLPVEQDPTGNSHDPQCVRARQRRTGVPPENQGKFARFCSTGGGCLVTTGRPSPTPRGGRWTSIPMNRSPCGSWPRRPETMDCGARGGAEPKDPAGAMATGQPRGDRPLRTGTASPVGATARQHRVLRLIHRATSERLDFGNRRLQRFPREEIRSG